MWPFNIILSILLMFILMAHPITSHYQNYYGGHLNNQQEMNPLYDPINSSYSCNYCNDQFANEPPPDDILFMPAPPLSPALQALFMPQSDMMVESEAVKQSIDSECNLCRVIDPNNDQNIYNNLDPRMYSRAFIILALTILISIMATIYFVRTRQGKIVASNIRATIFKSNASSSSNNSSSSKGSSRSPRPTDPCLMGINREKNLTSPIITDVPHKKTSIPSKYWAQPNSIIGNTISRIPNDYEVPSSRTNSTCTSSAVYADLTNEGHMSAQARIFSPYMHTYAEVLDPSDQITSGSGMILPDSNYDNAVYSHGSLVGHNLINGSVQLSDFNSMRPPQPVIFNSATNQTNPPNQMHIQHVNNIKPFATIQQPHRAQIIVTSENQGRGPCLLHFKEGHHDVI